MKTSVERVDDTTVKLSVTVEAKRVDAAIDEAARRLSSEVKVPGFRPGKVPRRVLEARLGQDALVQEALRGSLPEFYSEAVQSEQLDVISPPEFDVDTFAAGQDATFEATVEVRPEIEVPDVSSVQIPHPDWEVTDEEVAQQLDNLRERFAELETVSRGADIGDYAVITVTGTRDGERVEEASGEDLLYQLKDPGDTGSELDRELVGAEAGAILRFRDTLAEDYGDLAGTEVDFTVIVKEVKRKKLPELDDAFAQDASEFDTIDELRTELHHQLQLAKRQHARAELRGKVVEAVTELVEVPLPQALVQDELRFRLHRLTQQAEQYDMSLDQFLQASGTSADDLYGRLETEAQQTVKAQLVIDAIGQDAGIEVTRDDVVVEISRQAQRLGRPLEEVAEFMTHPDRMGAVLSDAFRRKTIDHLVASVQVLGGPPPEEETGDEAELADLEGHQTAAALAAAEAVAEHGSDEDDADEA